MAWHMAVAAGVTETMVDACCGGGCGDGPIAQWKSSWWVVVAAVVVAQQQQLWLCGSYSVALCSHDMWM